MKKTIATAVLAAAGFIGFGLAFSGPANAQICDNHGTGKGKIYVTACATGSGGSGGPWITYTDENGVSQQMPERDVYAP